jgi:hypothetical protein
MAASSATSATINLMPVEEKLNYGNHVLWKEQVLAVLRGVQLTGFLDGANMAPTEKNIRNFQIQPMNYGRRKNNRFLATY